VRERAGSEDLDVVRMRMNRQDILFHG
jgi:hypothetical protein